MGTGDGPFDPENGHLGNGLVAVKRDEGGELKLTGYYGPSNADWLWKRDLDINVSPMSFDHKGRQFVAGTSKECRVWLLDRDEFGGDDHRTPLYRTPLICNDNANYAAQGVWGAMAFWEDAKGDGWLAVPFYGPVSTQFHAPVELSPARAASQLSGWNRKRGNGAGAGMDFQRYRPREEAMQANGVLFTYASGETPRNDGGPRLELALRCTGSASWIAVRLMQPLRSGCCDRKGAVVATVTQESFRGIGANAGSIFPLSTERLPFWSCYEGLQIQSWLRFHGAAGGASAQMGGLPT
jgi:hypothetical protein